MIERIEFCNVHNTRIMSSGKTLRFTPGYNCVLGETGAGKTFLLHAITNCRDCVVVSKGNGKIYSYSTEHCDIRSRAAVRPSTGKALSETSGEKFRALSRLSHGEGNAVLFGASLKALALKEGDTFLVDEPEAGLDLAKVIDVASAFNHLCSKGIQVIVATHHPGFVSSLMSQNDQVLVLSGMPQDALSAYIEEWEVVIDTLRECFDQIDEGDGDADVFEVVAKSSNVVAASAARSID